VFGVPFLKYRTAEHRTPNFEIKGALNRVLERILAKRFLPGKNGRQHSASNIERGEREDLPHRKFRNSVFGVRYSAIPFLKYRTPNTEYPTPKS